jgi:hypothetical protein
MTLRWQRYLGHSGKKTDVVGRGGNTGILCPKCAAGRALGERLRLPERPKALEFDSNLNDFSHEIAIRQV